MKQTIAKYAHIMANRLEQYNGRLTPQFMVYSMKEIEGYKKIEGEKNVTLFPKRRNYRLYDNHGYQGSLLSRNPQLRRDILWAYEHRHEVNALEGNYSEIKSMRNKSTNGKHSEYALSLFYRPHEHTVLVTAIDEGSVYKYIYSEYEENLIQARLDGLEGILISKNLKEMKNN